MMAVQRMNNESRFTVGLPSHRCCRDGVWTHCQLETVLLTGELLPPAVASQRSQTIVRETQARHLGGLSALYDAELANCKEVRLIPRLQRCPSPALANLKYGIQNEKS